MKTTSPQKNTSHSNSPRKNHRYIVPWDVAIVESGTVHSAVIADISIAGVSLYLEKNLRPSDKIVITIKVPAYQGFREVIVGAECSLLYSILSSDSYGKFRIGFKFLNFRKNGRRDLLEAFSSRIAIGEHQGIYGI